MKEQKTFYTTQWNKPTHLYLRNKELTSQDIKHQSFLKIDKQCYILTKFIQNSKALQTSKSLTIWTTDMQ